jgi:hypothetical protein
MRAKHKLHQRFCSYHAVEVRRRHTSLESSANLQTCVTTTLNRKARQMKSELVELRFPGGHSASVSRPANAPARLAARGYTFTTVRGAGR